MPNLTLTFNMTASDYKTSIEDLRAKYNEAAPNALLELTVTTKLFDVDYTQVLLLQLRDLYLLGFKKGVGFAVAQGSAMTGYTKLTYPLAYGDKERNNFKFTGGSLRDAFKNLDGDDAEKSQKAFHHFCVVISEAARFKSMESKVQALLAAPETGKADCVGFDFDWTKHKDPKDCAIAVRATVTASEIPTSKGWATKKSKK